MDYLYVKWLHRSPDEPVELYSELNDERWEIRKVEVYADGRCGFADPLESSGDTMLGLVPVPPLDQIASEPEFEPRRINKSEFESIWETAHRSARAVTSSN